MDVEIDALIELMNRELDLDPGDVDATSEMKDVELWDSLAHLRLCMALEQEYGVKIPAERVGELITVPAIVEFLGSA
jgi:acyl carrier protein